MKKYISMKEITDADYQEFIKKHKEVVIEGTKIPLLGPRKLRKLNPPEFKLETSTVWSFPKRGDWATHKEKKYRGNWAPQIPRNIILRYSVRGDVVLDQMVGGGTTLVEAKLLGRNAVGVDINLDAIMLTRDRLAFEALPSVIKDEETLEKTWIKTYLGDARNLNLIEDESIDLIATHPPYANIIRYSKNSTEVVEDDLSKVASISEFVEEMKKVAAESYRVLKSGKYCVILIGDTRRNKHYVPIAFRVMQAFLDVGFILKEDIIKVQWNTKTEGLWAKMSREKNFLLIMHEHLFVFRKPEKDEKLKKYKESIKWW